MAAPPPGALTYSFRSVNPHDTFDRASAWRGSLGSWQCVLDNGLLQATANESFATEVIARTTLEPLLGAWVAVAYLRDQHEIAFGFESGSLPDASMKRAEVGVIESDPLDTGRIYRRRNDSYPPPDMSFTRTPLVNELLEIIRRFMRGALELPAALRELVSVMESSVHAGGPSAIGADYNIDDSVVATIAKLAGRGSISAHEGQPKPAYRGPEWQWMQEALRLVTLQAGRRSIQPPTKRLELDDFKTRL